LRLYDFTYYFIHVGAVGLHYIIGEAIGIVLIAVVYAEGGEEAAAYKAAGYYGAEYGIAIVEEVVWRVKDISPALSEGEGDVAKRRFQ